jgi:hypothetical protein
MTEKYQPTRFDQRSLPSNSRTAGNGASPLAGNSQSDDNSSQLKSVQRKFHAVSASQRALILIFAISIFSPFFFSVGPLRLSPNRLVLAISILPCFIFLISGKAGRILVSDILIMAYGLLAGMSLFVNHGLAFAIEPAGSLFIDVVGSYLLARTVVRNSAGFLYFSKTFCWLLLLILPFVVLESLTNRNIILEAAGAVLPVFRKTADMGIRLGLFRAQGTFEHPILFGIVASTGFSLGAARLSGTSSVVNRLMAFIPGVLTTFFSISSGSFLSVIVQAGILGWNSMFTQFQRRWLVLSCIALAAYVMVDLFSNRSPFHVFVTYLTFSTGSSYNRILIWDYGIAEVLRNPIFGIGLNDWIRAPWMSASVDNFWLLRAMRHGIIAWICLAGATFYTLRKLAASQKSSTSDNKIATAGISLFVGLSFAISTVDLWNCSQSLFLFLLGSFGYLASDDLYLDTTKPAESKL